MKCKKCANSHTYTMKGKEITYCMLDDYPVCIHDSDLEDLFEEKD